VWDRVPGLDEFQAIWEGHRNVLAGHLTRSEWGTVAGATTRYILRFAAERSDPPDDLDVKILREIAADLRAAEETLDRYCYEGPHVTDRVREAFRRLRGVRRASRDGSS
jgi:hypothetical protein